MTPRRRPLTARLVLAAYPRSFRRRYGDEVARSVVDLRRHGGVGRAALAARMALDVARSAPRMRWESLMSRRSRPLAIAVVLSVGLAALAVGSPVFVVVLGAVVVLLALLVRSGDRPIVADPGQTVRWHRWVVAGVAAFAVGFLILVVDGDELTSPGWAAWMLSWATGTVLVAFGLVLGAARLLHRPAR